MGKSLENKFRSANMGVHQIIYNAKDPYGQPVALLCFLLIKSHRIQAQPKGISESGRDPRRAQKQNESWKNVFRCGLFHRQISSVSTFELKLQSRTSRSLQYVVGGRKSGPGQRSTLCGLRENGKIMSTKVAVSIKTSMIFFSHRILKQFQESSSKWNLLEWFIGLGGFSRLFYWV